MDRVKLAIICGIIATASVLPVNADTAQELIAESGVQGGLVVHLGCGDGRLTAQLCVNDRYLVHGLDTNGDDVAKARSHIQLLGLYGKVSVETFGGDHLPYNDNVINLVVADDLGQVPVNEVMRVLAPRSVAVIGGKKIVKPWPDDIDQWTHYLHGPDNNAVAKDKRVASPRHVQWTAGPSFARDHDGLASLSSMVSSQGRVFYIFDEGPTSLIHQPPQWTLIARDAFNGILLWKRPIKDWITHLYYFRAGPMWLTRRLVAVDDKVYVTLGLNDPVVQLDAATGDTLQTYHGSEKTEEIILHNGVLLAAIGEPSFFNKEAKRSGDITGVEYEKQGVRKSVVAYKADTGEVLWKKDGANMKYLVPLSLSAKAASAFYMDNENIYCVDLETGRDVWQARFPTREPFLRHSAPTLVVHEDAVVCVSEKRMATFATDDGRLLWEKDEGYIGFNSPADVFVIGDSVWTGKITSKSASDGPREFDLQTGETRSALSMSLLPGGHHHRCFRNKATEDYWIFGRRGVEFIDLDGNDHSHNWWIRGMCQYGVMPCNGLLYVPPDPCKCFATIKLNGFLALSAATSAGNVQAARLEKGPAYGSTLPSVDSRTQGPKSPIPRATTTGRRRSSSGPIWSTSGIDNPSSDHDWPVYRHDIARSGSTKAKVSHALEQKWKSDLGGKLSSATSSEGKLFVSAMEQNTVFCLDAATGDQVWAFTANGQVDSPPTLHGGLATFGCLDGYVYAVRISDGKLAWRFRGAPEDRRIISDGKLASAWPIHGSVLALDETVYFAAGRSSFLDGGIRLYGIDAATGTIRYEQTVSASADRPTEMTGRSSMAAEAHSGRRRGGPKDAAQGDAIEQGVLMDLLVSDGQSICMNTLQLNKDLSEAAQANAMLLSSNDGFLDESWMHRVTWTIGQVGKNGMSYQAPYGELMVFNQEYAYGVQSRYTYRKYSPWEWPPDHTGAHHQHYSRYTPDRFPLGGRLYAQKNEQVTQSLEELDADLWDKRNLKHAKIDMATAAGHRWTEILPLQVRAMVITRDVLFIAGWKDAVDIFDPSPADDSGQPFLRALSPETGKLLAEYDLDAAPVFDGMIALDGRLYISLSDGTLLCMGQEDLQEAPR